MAAFAAAVKIDTFAYLPVQDFGNAYSTFIAQNYGAVKKPGMSVVLTVISLGIRVALAYLLSTYIGESGIWMAIPIGWILADITGLAYMKFHKAWRILAKRFSHYIFHCYDTAQFKNASAFLLRDARHAMHDILLL